MSKRPDAANCQWIDQGEAFRRFATHVGGVQSARHIKPLHWYIACRLVLEGGFDPSLITPRPPFMVSKKKVKRKILNLLSYEPELATGGEQVILGGLKTKNVDVVVTNPDLGPVVAISCKGVTKAFRNLTNRMEETIGECTNLHITYPALIVGYCALLRANRTIKDALEAPEDSASSGNEAGEPEENETASVASEEVERIAANDIAILEDGSITEGIVRFSLALSEMTNRHGVRDEISRYEAIALSLIEPKGAEAGGVVSGFPSPDSPLHLSHFFSTIYQRYEERFVIGAPLLADRGITTRLEWSSTSPVFAATTLEKVGMPSLGFEPRLAAD